MYALSLENLQHILSILKLSCISTIPLNGQNSYNLQKKTSILGVTQANA